MKKIALFAACALLCLGLWGCAEPASTSPEPAPTATPSLTPQPTPEPTPEPTPAPPPGLALSGEGDSAYAVTSAVVGEYYVYLRDANLCSRPYADPHAQPIVLAEAIVSPFHVWSGYVVYYAKPDEATPYRSILVRPDGSDLRVIDERQHDFYNPVAGVGDYLYAWPGPFGGVDALVRHSLSKNSVEVLFPVGGQPVGILEGFYYAVDYAQGNVWRYDLDTGERQLAFYCEEGIKSIVAARGFILITTPGEAACALLPDGTARKLAEGPIVNGPPWATTAECIVFSVYQDMDAFYADAVLHTYCVTAQGMYPVTDVHPVQAFYPVESGEGSFYVQAGPEGQAYLMGVDMEGFIPMEEFETYGEWVCGV